MANLFVFLFLITFVLLIISLIKPGLLNRVIKRELSRKQSTLGISAILIILIVLIGITAPPQNKKPETNVKGEAITQEVTQSPTIEPTPITSPSPNPSPVQSPTVSITPSPKPSPISSSTNQDILSCKNGTYKNVDGNLVCNPEYSETVPPGATAVCGDGTYSFSQHRQGTCSHHGGVARWL